MNHFTRSLLPLAVLTLAITRLTAADTYEIKKSWPVGKKVSQTMKMDQTSSMELAGQKMEQKMNMTFEMSTGVTKHEDGKQKRLAVKYDRMAMDMTMGPQKFAFDSAKPEDDALGLGKMIGGIVGKEFKVLVNANDEVTDIENYDAVAGALGGGAASPLGQMFGKDQMVEMMKQGALHSSPGKPVKVGDSWPLNFTMKAPPVGSITIKGTYTLKGAGPHDGVPCLEIAMDATLATDAGGAGTPAQVAALGAKITGGKTAGTLWFDPALGMVRGSDSTQSMEISMKNPTQPDATMTIPMNQHIIVTMTKVEDLK
jgi:hypothetical protein